MAFANPAALLALRALRPGLFAAGVSFEPLLPAASFTASGSGKQLAAQRGTQLRLGDAAGQDEERNLQPQTHLQLVSTPQSWGAVLVPCYTAATGRARRSWAASGVRLPW